MCKSVSEDLQLVNLKLNPAVYLDKLCNMIYLDDDNKENIKKKKAK
jgi:hypothetical protein